MSSQKTKQVDPLNSKTKNTLKILSPSSRSCEPSLDWMEEELARVCGEGSDNSPPINSPPENVASPPKSNKNLIEQSALSNNNNNYSNTKQAPENIKEASVKSPNINGFNWRLLRKRNEAELEKKLKKIEMAGGTEKRARLERRFTELFGPDDVPTSASTGKRKDRDEVAALTVKHLMPMYKKQKIASKELFKKLAKHISNCIMEQVDCPGENDVQNRVQKLFANGKNITCEEDISSI